MNENTCRLCLQKHQKMFNVFNPNCNNLEVTVFQCVSIKIKKTDMFSKMLCLNCYFQIINWNDFKQMCNKTDTVLRKQYLLNHSHKTENFSLKPIEEREIQKDETNQNSIKNTDCLKENTNSNKHKLLSTYKESTIYFEDNVDQTIPNQMNDKSDNDKVIIKNEISFDKENFQNICKTNKNCRNIIWSDNNLEEYISMLERTDLIETCELELENLKKQPYTCDICLTEYDNMVEYLDHQFIHEGKFVFKCDRCTKVFTNKKELKTHESKHQIACLQCDKKILASSMRAHLISHTNKYQCSTCSLCFATRANLSTHVISTHTNIKEHVCETCGKRFSTKTSLTSHHKTHSEIRAYHCKFCSYAGRTASALYIHKSKHENASYNCEICLKTFKNHRCLKDHKRRVHSNNKRHECSYCHRKFVEKYMLTVHLRTHTGARPYECKICLCTFVRSDGLKEHMGTHGDRPSYNCKKCGKRFIYRRSLSRHNCLQSF